MQTQSVLERMFRAGHLAVTSECGPPGELCRTKFVRKPAC